MKKNLLKMALLAFATFAASVASAQSTYVLYGNVGEGEVKLSTTRDKASGGTMTVSDYSENGQKVGFTQTITGTGGWFMSFDLLGSEINPTILKNTEYNLVYDVRTSWSGDVKLKFEVQSANVHTEKSVSFDHDGEWHTITIPVQSWVDANVLQTIESSSRVIFGFVGGNWDVKKPTTIDYRNVKLVPVNVVPDTEVPTWGSDPVAQNETDKTAEIVVNVIDDSGSAVITLTGDNGFVEVKKTVKADGTDQTIALNGLTANTDYNLTLAIADAAGNAGESKTVNFTTQDASDLDVRYHSFNFTSENWTKRGDSNTFAPNGNILLTVNADNTVTVKVTVDEGAETVDNAQVILHGIETFWINAQEDGSFVGTSTKSISNREASQAFHLNFVLKGVAKNSELNVMSFTPSEGSTSAVAEVEAEAAKVVAANGVIRVEGDKTFAVYTVAGQLAFRGMGEVRLDKGVYVVVVDGKAQKVML